MISKRLFRFGLPLGSATIVVAILDLTIGIYWLLNDVGSSLFFHWCDNSEPVGRKTVINLVLISFRGVLALFLWIFVLLKQRSVLIFWIPFSVITDVLFLGYAIFSHPLDFVSDELWIFNVFLLFMLRCYLTAIIFQTLKRLVRNSRLKNEQVLNGNSTPATETSSAEVSNKYLLVEPIGKSPSNIWRYYDHNPRLGAAVLVAFEMTWNVFALSTHKLTEFLLGGRLFFFHREEEVIMRAWRIIIDIFALYFILKRRKTLVRFWLIIYFWTMFLSIGFTIWTVVDWTFETPLVVILVICCTSLSDIILRFGVMYFCLMLSLQTHTSVSRAESLKSEARSVHFTMPNASRNHALVDRAIFAGNQF